MTLKLMPLYLLLLLTVIVCNGQVFDFTIEPENCLCNCSQSMCDLVEFIKELDKRLSVASQEIHRLQTLHHRFANFQRESRVEHKEMRNIINKLSRQLNSNKNPTSESLILQPEAIISTSPSIMADEAGKIAENFTTLIEDKFKEVNSLSSEVTELQQENKVLKEEIEEEKRVRRSLQHQVYFVEERLNQTQSWVLEINEKVNDKDSENSTVVEVAEIVFAKISEFDVLNKTAIEKQLKKLEYTVKDAFKNETHLAHRLDSVENASAYTVGLLGNGTLVDKVHDIASTVQALENVQSKQTDVVSQLEQQVNVVNSSLAKKLKEVEYTVAMIDFSVNETKLSIENELVRMNDTWNEKSAITDRILVRIDEKITESTNLTGRAINATKDVEVFFTSLYTEAINNLSIVQEEVGQTWIKLQELAHVSDELTSIKSIMNQTVDRDEFSGLWDNITKQSKFLEDKVFSFYANLSGIINDTEGKVAAMEGKYGDDKDLIQKYLSDFAAHEQQAKERIDGLHVEFQNLIANETETFSNLLSHLDDLSSKVKIRDQENAAILSTFAYNVSKLHDLQAENKRTVMRSFEVMEKLLLRKIDAHKEELTDLINKIETSINSTRQREEVTGDVLSRAKIDLGGDSTEATTEEPVQCFYAPLTTDGELVAAYVHDAGFEELSEEVFISHGEQLFFSCKRIGKFILTGPSTLTCVDGQWSDTLPSCEKLLDESIIRDSSQDQGDPCLEPRGQFPDPSDCRYFFDCWDGSKSRKKCQNGLHFNAISRICDYVNSANCSTYLPKGKVDQLQDIIPPIDFAPLGVDVANSLLSAGITGELVVYPGVNLNLICLYPRKLGEPHWEIMEEVPHPHLPAWDTKGVTDVNAYKLKLAISAITEEYSGNYTCVTPRGRRHTVRLLVKAVTCPEFDVDADSHVSVSYRPNPDGLQRVMTTQASFDCSPGYYTNGSRSAICKASGSWSHILPSCQKEEISGCSKPVLHTQPKLYADPDQSVYSVGKQIYFRCKGHSIPTGITTARCSSGGIWTVRNGPLTESDLPVCF